MVELLHKAGVAELLVCEPLVDELPEHLIKLGIHNVDTNEAVRNADIILYLTAHDVFRQIGTTQLEGKIAFDACGLNK